MIRNEVKESAVEWGCLGKGRRGDRKDGVIGREVRAEIWSKEKGRRGDNK